jgi:predicted secreted hydrolase
MVNPRWVTWSLAAGLLIALVVGAYALWPGGQAAKQAPLDLAGILRALETVPSEAAAETDAGHAYAFPADHGPHPAHPTDVWDLRAVLSADDGGPIGLRATFLRLALAPSARTKRASRLAAEELIAARIALSPGSAHTGSQDQRAGRAVLDIAGSDADPASVWVEDWRLARLGDASWQLQATLDSGSILLRLVSDHAAGAEPILIGSALGPPEAMRSSAGTQQIRRYQMPRLTATGSIDTGTGPRQVTGSAWLDHGWGDLSAVLNGRQGQLKANQFRLRLDDGTMLDCLELRRIGGGGTPIPSCTLTSADGARRTYQRRALSLIPDERAWTAPDGIGFPLRWRLQIPAERLDLRFTPLVEDQRIHLLDQPIWSGPLIVDGMRAGQSAAGIGWMDLSGD